MYNSLLQKHIKWSFNPPYAWVSLRRLLGEMYPYYSEDSASLAFLEGLNVINGHKCNKVLNVITFCPKCNNNLA